MDELDPDYFLRGSNGPVTSLAYFRPKCLRTDGFLLSGSQFGSLYAWDLKTRRVVNHVSAHNQSLLSISIIADDEIITQGRDGFLHRWKVDGTVNWTKLDSIPSVEHGFCPIVCFKMNDSLLVAMPSHDQSGIELKQLESKNIVMTLVPSGDSCSKPLGLVMDIKAVVNDENDIKIVVAAYENGSIIVWDLRSAGRVLSQNNFHNEIIMSFDFSRHTSKGLSGSANSKLILWNINKEGAVTQSHTHEMPADGVGCIKARSDGKLFAVGCWDSTVRLYSGKKLTPLATFCAHRQSINCLTFDRDNSFAVGSKDGSVTVWSAYKNQ